VRIDCILTLGESLVKGTIIVVGESGIALEKPIESQGSGLTVLLAKIRNGRVLFENDDFVKINHDDVRLQLGIMSQKMVLRIGLLSLRGICPRFDVDSEIGLIESKFREIMNRIGTRIILKLN
jgi:hypothetical protein